PMASCSRLLLVLGPWRPAALLLGGRGWFALSLGKLRFSGFSRFYGIGVVADGAGLLANTVGKASPRRDRGARKRLRLRMIDDFLGTCVPDINSVLQEVVMGLVGLVQQLINITRQLRVNRLVPSLFHLVLLDTPPLCLLCLLRLG